MTQDKKTRAIDQLKKLDGTPPYDDGGDLCRGDGYFAKSIVAEFGMSLEELARESGYLAIWSRTQDYRRAL